MIYKDDPEYIYDYKYSIDEFKNLLNYKAIRCTVYTQNNTSVYMTEDENKIKYLPLE